MELEEAISIIGGADGPTSIYILRGAMWEIVVFAVILFVLFALLIYGFIKNVRKRKILKSILCGIPAFIFIVVVFISAIFAIQAYKDYQTIKHSIENSVE